MNYQNRLNHVVRIGVVYNIKTPISTAMTATTSQLFWVRSHAHFAARNPQSNAHAKKRRSSSITAVHVLTQFFS